MARSIRDMKGRGNNATPVSGKDEANRGNAEGVSLQSEEDVSKLVSKYSTKSEDELMHELLDVTARQKKDGSLKPEQIEAAAKSIIPMLNAEQVKKLNSILERIK